MTVAIACDVSSLNCPACMFETATLSGGPDAITLNNGAWCVINWDPLLEPWIRGGDLIVPDVDYVLPRRRYLDRVGPLSLPMLFDGNVDEAGVSHAPLDVMEGLELNRRDFIANAVTPPNTTDNLFTLTITMADGTAFTGPLHCDGPQGLRWSRGEVEGMARAIWRISLPLGLTVVPPP